MTPAAPRLGDTGEVSGDPYLGDKVLLRATPYGVSAHIPGMADAVVPIRVVKSKGMAQAQPSQRPMRLLAPNAASLFALAVIVPTLGGLAFEIARDPSVLIAELPIWILLVAVVELLPAPAWRGVQVGLGFPLLISVAILYAPVAAALAALLGSSDPREYRREIAPLTAVFNRCQVALAVWAGSSVLHSLATPQEPVELAIGWLTAASLLASAVDYAINISLVAVLVSLIYRLSPLAVVRQLSKGQEFLVSYMGLGVLGAAMAKLFEVGQLGFLSVFVVLAPLLFARQMFRRTHALEAAHKELQEREEILRELSNTMAEERADERLKIAGYLHDDLAQVLFRLSLQVDIARKMLEKGDLRELEAQLEKIRESKQDTSDRIRALIRDLHRSPLGAKGLSEALESFTDEVGRDSGVVFHRDVEEVPLPAPIALLVYHVAREGVMNALKHAQATDMWISVAEEADEIVLRLRDNGIGFDTSAPGPEGHYGMAMMRERAKVGGGSLDVQSAPGEGTSVTVRFPTALLQREQTLDSGQASSSDPERASPGTSGTTPPTAEGSRDSVPA
jgi:signal transduction histidine kinase